MADDTATAVKSLEQNIEQNVEQVAAWVDALIEFAVTYGFQIVGALIFLVIGLKIAAWVGLKVQALSEGKGIDITLSRFFGGVAKVLIIAVLVIITLGNFGVSIAPLIALAGASAFGATMAIQGPLSNYGAGLSIILARPFKVGNTITVGQTSGVVDDIKMAHTTLVGEDGEVITIPNKDIVGRVIVNSETRRVVQTKVSLDPAADLDGAVRVVTQAVARALPAPDDGAAGDAAESGEGAKAGRAPAPQVGLHDFTYGGLVLGVRFWVPSSRYYELRYQVNGAILAALKGAGVPLMAGGGVAVLGEDLSGDGMAEGQREDG